MSRMLAATTFLYGQRSKCADLSVLLPNSAMKTGIPHIKDVTTLVKYGRVILVKIPDKGR